jgi:hypothetical protein
VQYRGYSFGFASGTWLCAALLVGCAGGGGAGSVRPTSVVPPALTESVAVAPAGVIRRTKSAGTCTTAGAGSFNGVSANANVAGGTDSVVGGGSSNEGCDDHAAITGGFENVIAGTSNGATDSFIGGGHQNQIYATAAYSVIAGGYGNTVDPTNGNSSIVGGGEYNTASSAGAAVLGGETNTSSGFISTLGGGQNNTVSGDYGFDGGGAHNTVSQQYGAIGGGNTNTVSGQYGFVGAGSTNTVSAMYGGVVSGANNKVTTYDYGFIGGGYYNTVSGEGAVATGGYSNEAKGTWSTIPGGVKNITTGEASFAAGVGSYAATTGAFVWSDDASGATQLKSTVANQFLARASGGVTFWTNATNTVGATLAAGSGTWASASDRNLKTDVARIDDAAVLDKVATLPIERWSYKSERGVHHVGPMAQDFYAAFGVGEDDKHITSIDEDGVALAAIKALRAENLSLKRGQRELRTRLRAVTASHEDEIADLRAQLTALRTIVLRSR